MAEVAAVAAPSSAAAITPTATAVTTPAAAASTQEPAAVTTPVTETVPEQSAGEDSGDFFARELAKATAPKADEPAVEVKVEKTAEEIAAEEAAAAVDPDKAAEEEKPAEKTAEEIAAEAATEDEYDPYEQTPGPLPPKELNAKINANPALKAAIEADPDLKNSLFAASRLAAETASFKEVFANAEEAKVAAAGNQEFAALSDLVTSIDKPEDAQGFYARLMELSILHDEDGNPILDKASGKPISDGTVGRLIHHTGALFLNHFGSEAEVKNDPELAAAVDILRARAFGSGPAPTTEEMTEEQRAKATELDARETALKEQAKAVEQAKVKEFNQSVTSGIDLSTDAEITKLLARTDIPEKDRADLADKIRQGVYELIVQNPQFRNEQDALMRRPMGDKTRQARIGLGKKYVDLHLSKVASKIIADAGAKILSRQGKAQAAQAAREEASRSEAAGTLRTAKPITAQTSEQVADTAIAALTTKLGRAPSMTEMLAEIQRMKSAT